MGDDGDDTGKRHRQLSPTSDGLHNRQSLPFLPDELIFRILSWLPVRTLLQFKRVCISWKTLISDPQFAYNHFWNLTLNSSLTHQRLFCSGIGRPCKIVSYPVNPLLETPSEPIETVEFTIGHKIRIIGSCNGLLCLLHNDQGYVKLWNPCIRFQSNRSQPFDCIDYRRIRYYGFGYDHVNDKYKVLLSLCRARLPTASENVTQIYTFGENCWTTVDNSPCYATEMVGMFVSGTLNWITFSVSSKKYVILSFNLEKETFKEVLVPENDGVETWNHMLGIFNNCLCVCFGPIKDHWNLWVMKKYGVAESWTRLTMIPHEQLHNCVQQPIYFIKPLFIFENSTVLLSINTKFLLFNLNNGRLDKCLLGSRHIGFQQHIYYESLVSPQF